MILRHDVVPTSHAMPPLSLHSLNIRGYPLSMTIQEALCTRVMCVCMCVHNRHSVFDLLVLGPKKETVPFHSF